MKQFRFPLDSVLHWREMTVEQEEAKLRGLLLEDQRIALAIEQTWAEGAAAERAIREQREIMSTDLRSLGAFRLRLEEKRRTLHQQKAQQAALIDQQRRAVLEAQRRFQLLVKLRARRESEWQYEAGRETETFSQEAFLGRWSARKRLAANK
jgi:flagellar biosynthesis chaperone FliJ